MHLVEVAASDEDVEGAIRYLDSVARHNDVTSWDVLQGVDVGEMLADTVAGSRDGTMCLATHGRDRSASLLGSVAASLLDRSDRPALLVGPHARPARAVDTRVVVAVDGTARDEALLPVGLGWAARLARRLVIATVAEPAPASYREPEATPRSHGPADPERYLASLAGRARGAGVAVATEVIYDPTSVRDGLVPLLGREAALVVLGSRHRHGVPRMVLGSHAARIVHDTPVPALVVPFTSGP